MDQQKRTKNADNVPSANKTGSQPACFGKSTKVSRTPPTSGQLVSQQGQEKGAVEVIDIDADTLARTSPRRSSVPEVSSEGVRKSDEMEKYRSELRISRQTSENTPYRIKKRKAEGSPKVDEVLTDDKDFRSLLEIATQLAMKVEKSKNTRNDIAQDVRNVVRLIKRLEQRGTGTRVEPMQSKVEESRPIMVDQGTQTLASEKMEEEMKAHELRRRLDAAKSTEEVVTLVKEDWVPKVFQKTSRTTKSFVTDREVRVALVGAKSSKDLDVLGHMERQFPALRQVRERLQAGKVATITSKDSVTFDGEEEHAPAVPRVLAVAKVSDPLDLSKTINATKSLVETIAKKGCGKATFYLPEALDGSIAEKVLECCLRDVDLKAEICIRGRRTRSNGTGRGVNTMSRVTVSGKSYAEMVGSLKGSVGTGHDGVLIRGARKTHDGQLQLRIRETRVGGSQSFLSKIQEMNLSTKVRSETKTIAVVIRDLDETATVDEIRTSLAETLKGGEKEATISQPRQSFSGGYSAVVRLPKMQGVALLSRKRLLVGLFSCRIGEAISPRICARCLKTGHAAKDCTVEGANARRCYRCGQSNHFAKECKAPKKCFNCTGESGKEHYANTMSCPIYRMEVREAKTARKSSTEHGAAKTSANKSQ